MTRRSDNITLFQLKVLSYISNNPDCTSKQVAQYVWPNFKMSGWANSRIREPLSYCIGSHLTKMQNQGFLIRTSGKLKITPAGEIAVERLRSSLCDLICV